MRSISLIAILLISAAFAKGQRLLKPTGLMVDLVEYSDYQSQNGHRVVSSIANFSDKNIQSVLIGNISPTFSWEMNSTGKNALQTAYQILIADSWDNLRRRNGNVWNSGKINGSQSSGVVFTGRLKPHRAYYWTVRVWDNHRQASLCAEAKVFYTDIVLSAHQTPSYPIQLTDQSPLKLIKSGNVYRADFGKDGFGQIKMRLTSGRDNDSVIVRIGEIVNADGTINRKPPGTIRYAQYVIKMHPGTDWYRIKIRKNALNTKPLTIKMPDYIGEVTPYRYCELEGYKGALAATDMVRLMAHYQFDDKTVQFHSSDTTINAVWELCKYSMKATSFLGTYVDGDRERLAYEADAYINQLSHYAVDKEYTIARKTHEHLITTPTWPTEWILFSVLIAWNDYLYTGDIQSAKYYFNELKAKSLTALEDSTGLISTQNGKVSKELLEAIHFSKDGRRLEDIVDWPHGAETDGFVFTRYNAVVNAFYYRALVSLAKIAAGIGKTAEAAEYLAKSESVKRAFNNRFYDAKRGVYIDGIGTEHASLHANMFALAFDLADSVRQLAVLNFVKSRGMKCSVYGSQFLLDAIYNAGDGNYGLKLLTDTSDRSWYNMIRVGSTITLEAWDNKYKPNQDWNHAWGAAAGNIISRKLMGIEPLTPGWQKFCIKPQIGNLRYAEIDVPTIKGTIHVLYKQASTSFTAEVNIPANTTAEVYLPKRSKGGQRVLIDGRPVSFVIKNSTLSVGKIGSGRHIFEVKQES